MYLLGIDLGTSSVKAIVTSADGYIVGEGQAEYPTAKIEATWAEQYPDQWWSATARAIRLAISESKKEKKSIAAIGVTGQMHGTVLLDPKLLLNGPAIIWSDQRSSLQAIEINERIGHDRLIHLTGSTAATGFQAASVRWIQQNQPDRWRQTYKILTPKDYLRWLLTGQFGTEPSDASGTLYFDVRRRDWSSEIVEKLNLNPDLLPAVRKSSDIAGYLKEDQAKILGLKSGIPIIFGAADTAAGLLGAGVIDEHSLLITISSGGQIIKPAENLRVDYRGRLHTFCSTFEPGERISAWYQMAAILSAGLSMRWLRDKVFELSSVDAYDRMTSWANHSPPGARGLIFLPYLSGERTPHMDSMARGVFLGLVADHGKGDIVRAVMEGVAFACYDAYQSLAELEAQPTQIIIAGGGSKSSLWCQIFADIFDMPIRPLIAQAQAARGVALLAGAGTGLLDLHSSIVTWVDYGETINPTKGNRAIYNELFAIFKEAYPKHQDDFGRLYRLDRGSAS